jgi:hypothetical protein
MEAIISGSVIPNTFMFIRFAMVFLLDKTVVERRRGPSARIFVIITYNKRFVNRRCAVFDIFLGEILWDFDEGRAGFLLLCLWGVWFARARRILRGGKAHDCAA